eukprot:4402785-Pleurochrysis_carterae.AAC.1
MRTGISRRCELGNSKGELNTPEPPNRVDVQAVCECMAGSGLMPKRALNIRKSFGQNHELSLGLLRFFEYADCRYNLY